MGFVATGQTTQLPAILALLPPTQDPPFADAQPYGGAPISRRLK